jgi:ABC-type xylose transport system permease subunit
MGLLAWSMMGLAIWHFTVFLPDRFWGGIVGAFVGALIGAVVVAFLISGLHVPGRDDTDIVTVLYAIPGTLIGLAAVYYEGVRRERAAT